MTMTAALFTRAPESISGYTPKFLKDEVLLGYELALIQPGRGLGYIDDGDSMPIAQHSIIVQGRKIIGKMSDYFGDEHSIVAAIANEFIASAKKDDPAREWLIENALDLSNSNRYWQAMIRIKKIREAKAKVYELQEQIRLAEIMASVDAIGVNSERDLSVDERYLHAIEFGLTRDEWMNLQ